MTVFCKQCEGEIVNGERCICISEGVMHGDEFDADSWDDKDQTYLHSRCVKDEIIGWDVWEKKESKAIIDSMSIAIGELERRGVTESENNQLITIGVLIEKLCLKGQCRCRSGKEGDKEG